MATLLHLPLRRATYLRTKIGLVDGLRLFWIVVVLWCEVGVFLWSVMGCHWPDRSLSLNALASPTHILLIADPQILNDRSYPGRPQWLMSLTQYIVDLNLRKSWNVVISKFHPDMVVFLGDMMDNGRSNIDESEYEQYHDRFRSIFQLDAAIPVYYQPGNHDVDLGYSSGLISKARDRYHDHFGATNQRVDVGNHTSLVLFDAPGLVDEDYRRHAEHAHFRDWQGNEGGAVEFLKDFIEDRPLGPVILFSHIPLFRSDRVSCGPLREKGTIRPGVGHGYQNLLLRETSSFILENIRPSVVFSGDDHDYCEYHHYLADGSTVREVTVKSFSMAMGVRQPGFQLLSLAPSSPLPASSTIADVPCLLPDQIKIYTHGYAPLGLLTILLLFFLNYRQRGHRQGTKGWIEETTQASSHSLFFSCSGSSDSSNSVKHRHSPSVGPILLTTNSHGDEEAAISRHLVAPADAPSSNPDDLYSLPRPYANSTQNHSLKNRGLRVPSSGRDRLKFAIVGPARVCYTWWTGSGRHQTHARAVKDFCQVAWPPIWTYIIVSLWLFWR